ncbi:MAG: hypothetical protein L6R48_12855 [Planctomycetes bacterium]|nr:hypothetical protein [Planctomycetota bacterium]
MPNPILALLLAGLASAPLLAAEGGQIALTVDGVPGGLFANKVAMTASVTAIDATTRMLTLKGQDGAVRSVRVSDAAVNFPQIKVGDSVRVELAEELVVAMVEDGAKPAEGVAAGVALAPVGAKPGAVAVKAVQVTATVTAIDAGKRTATLTFADGAVRTVAVRPDIDLSKRKAGEKVRFTLTESVAILVEKP